MDGELKIKLYETTIDCIDPLELAKFYAALLHWDIVPIQGDEYVIIAPPGIKEGDYPCLAFQRNPAYVPPVWPEEPGAQQQMEHLDFAVNDVEKAVIHAVECGAKIAEKQFSEYWRVMLDPAGHPFCLCDLKRVFE
jgi:predicted enzyme related to lactoylglutathione lyase